MRKTGGMPINVYNIAKINRIILGAFNAPNSLHNPNYGKNFKLKIREKETTY